MQPTVNTPELPSFDDEVASSGFELPEIEDEIKQRWEHEKLITAEMTSCLTETSEGRPQLEVTMLCNGTKQMFWARIGAASSNWALSRYTLPYVNTIRSLKGQDLYPFATELNSETLMKYLKSPWVQNQMAKPLKVRMVTSVRDAFDQRGNKKRNVNCEFVHLNDEGSKNAFDAIKAIKQKTTLETASRVNQAIAPSQTANPNDLM